MSRRTILVVDDSPSERALICQALQRGGYSVLVAQDGDAGLKLAKEQAPALVLLDVMMPGKNGYQVCRQLKSDMSTRNLPVVLVTARDQPPDRFWGMRQGADEYITKPFDPERLLDVVGRLV
jgi:twitching motility two-component system response regulator PilH